METNEGRSYIHTLLHGWGQHIRDRVFKLSSNMVVHKRLEECYRCEYLQSFDRCKSCGCFIQPKVRVRTARCPEGKW